MSAPLAVVLDVEGTTTPASFVHDVLFAYARERLPEFIRRNRHRRDVGDALAALAAEYARDAGAPLAAPLERYALWLIDQDRKSTPLKALQGCVWAEGYAAGELAGELYPDVPQALLDWREAGTTVAIFSSGSVLAQQLLFRHSRSGDLGGLVHAYFDTNLGHKREPASYARICASLRIEPRGCLFVSDTEAELDAARSAGLGTALCARDGRWVASCADSVIGELTALHRRVAA